MKTVTKIIVEEAIKMYFESQRYMEEKIGKGKRLTFYNEI